MADFPLFPFTTQEDWYGEMPFESAEDGSPLSLEGRRFVMLVTPAASGAALVEPKITLSMGTGGGLALKDGTTNTLLFRVPRTTTEGFPRGEYTADIHEEVDGERHLFQPVRIQYTEPSGLRAYVSRFIGVKVTFAARVQPIVTPVAIAGRQGAPGATILYGTAPPAPVNGKDGDFYIQDQSGSGRSRLMYGPRANGVWPFPPWSIQTDGTHTPVDDRDYQCLPTDTQVGMVSLTAPRTVFLPDVDAYPVGQDLLIADESGACSETLPITIAPGPGTSDVLGVPGGVIQLFTPYQALRFRRGAANLWIRL